MGVTMQVPELNSIKDVELQIAEIETGLSDQNNIIYKMFTQKKDIIRYLADCYEVLVINGKIDIQKNQIAKHLMKRMKEINADITKTWIYESLPSKYKFQ